MDHMKYVFGSPQWDNYYRDDKAKAQPHQPHPDHTYRSRWVQGELFDPKPYRQPIQSQNPYPAWEGLPEDWTVGTALNRLADLWQNTVLSETQRDIIAFGVMLTDLVLRKNQRYGNSAIDPVSVFATGLTPRERMAVRMDDKINRIVHGQGTHADDGENPVVDLAGYLLLMLVSEHRDAKG